MGKIFKRGEVLLTGAKQQHDNFSFLVAVFHRKISCRLGNNLSIHERNDSHNSGFYTAQSFHSNPISPITNF